MDDDDDQNIQQHRDAFARVLRELRISHGLSKAELARRAGTTPDTIVAYEAARRAPGFERWLLLCRSLDTPMSEFVARMGS